MYIILKYLRSWRERKIDAQREIWRYRDRTSISLGKLQLGTLIKATSLWIFNYERDCAPARCKQSKTIKGGESRTVRQSLI